MFKLTHLIVALIATVAIALSDKSDSAPSQVILSAPTASAYQPLRDPANPLAQAVYRTFQYANCTSQPQDFLIFPNTCYFVWGGGGSLLGTMCTRGEF